MKRYNLKEAAGEIGISVKALYDLIENGAIPSPKNDPNDSYARFYTGPDIEAIRRTLNPQRSPLIPLLLAVGVVAIAVGVGMSLSGTPSEAGSLQVQSVTEPAVQNEQEPISMAAEIEKEREIRRIAHTASPAMFQQIDNLEAEPLDSDKSEEAAKKYAMSLAGLE